MLEYISVRFIKRLVWELRETVELFIELSLRSFLKFLNFSGGEGCDIVFSISNIMARKDMGLIVRTNKEIKAAHNEFHKGQLVPIILEKLRFDCYLRAKVFY